MTKTGDSRMWMRSICFMGIRCGTETGAPIFFSLLFCTIAFFSPGPFFSVESVSLPWKFVSKELNRAWSALCASWANIYTVSRLLFECVVGVWLSLGSVYVSSRWPSVSGWVEYWQACVCVCWCDMSTYLFIIYVILCLYYWFLWSITSLCCCKCFGLPLHVLKLMSLILVKLNCPVRDD